MSDGGPFTAVPTPEPLAAVVHARVRVEHALDELAAAQAFRDLAVDAAIAAGYDPVEMHVLGGDG